MNTQCFDGEWARGEWAEKRVTGKRRGSNTNNYQWWREWFLLSSLCLHWCLSWHQLHFRQSFNWRTVSAPLPSLEPQGFHLNQIGFCLLKLYFYVSYSLIQHYSFSLTEFQIQERERERNLFKQAEEQRLRQNEEMRMQLIWNSTLVSND